MKGGITLAIYIAIGVTGAAFGQPNGAVDLLSDPTQLQKRARPAIRRWINRRRAAVQIRPARCPPPIIAGPIPTAPSRS